MGYLFVMKTKLHELFVYCDGLLIWRPRKQRGFTNSNKVAGILNKGYLWIKTSLLPKQISVHVAVWVMHNGDVPDGMVVDHKDRNTMNNRIENLRVVTRSQNAMNAIGKRNKKSNLPKGVYVDWTYKGVTRYRAQICVGGVLIRSGNHVTIEEASSAYKELAMKHFGEYNIKEGD